VAHGSKAAGPALKPTESTLPPGADAGLYRTAVAWYTETEYITAWNFNNRVTGNLDLYAKGTETAPVNLSGQTGDHTLAKALNYIAAQNLSAPANYNILLDAGKYTLPGISDQEQANINKANAVITLAGKGLAEISLSSNGSLFYITAGELVLDNNITLIGLSSNNRSLIFATGSSLTIKNGATIKGNRNADYSAYPASYGGGVRVENGSFTMNGGVISGNSAVASNFPSYGGGVYVRSNNFTMSGGEISGNSSSAIISYGGGVYLRNYTSGVNPDGRGAFTISGGIISNNSISSVGSYGGGVFVDAVNSNFIMSGGEISGNSITTTVTTTNNYRSYGGGVYVSFGSFTMSSGKISGNSSAHSFSRANGGGVAVEGSSFTMGGGEISGNSASYIGGGVYIIGQYLNDIAVDGNFTMNGGVISGNSAYYGGGGVYVGGSSNSNDSFTMSGGTISGNSANNGGGVYFWNSFIMSGGTISGNSANYGGGVYTSDGSFSKTGNSIIYGDNDGNPDNGNATDNTARTGNTKGHAVYNQFPGHYRDTTLNTGDSISTSNFGSGWDQ
jgi:hypothetical protein